MAQRCVATILSAFDLLTHGTAGYPKRSGNRRLFPALFVQLPGEQPAPFQPGRGLVLRFSIHSK